MPYDRAVPKRFIVEEPTLPLASAMRGVAARGYRSEDFRADLGAGVTVGIVALPLSMALAIASGAPPQLGLFTAIVGGAVVALAGGSMYSVTGPTAAFVVLLAPVTARYGASGLMVATLMAGAILVAMGLLRLGNLIQFIPHPVTTGFTAGIGVTIAMLQLGDFLGLGSLEGDRIWERIGDLADRFPQSRWPDVAIGFFALALMIFFPKLTTRFPAPLVAVVAAAVAGVLLTASGSDVTTITTQFGGIPATPPTPVLPWTVGEGTSWALVPELAPTAVAIAMLGAIESLLWPHPRGL